MNRPTGWPDSQRKGGGESRAELPPGSQPLPPHEKDNRDTLRGHQRLDIGPRGAKTSVQTPPEGRLRKGLARVRKELTGRFYQLLSGHAATAEHLVRIGQAPSERCWFCLFVTNVFNVLHRSLDSWPH